MNLTEPTFEEMVELLEGNLSEQESATVRSRLNNAVPSVKSDFEWLRAFMELRPNLTLESAPANVRATLADQFKAYSVSRSEPQSSQPDGTGFFQSLIASLTFDSRLQGNLAGVRSAQLESEHQLVFSSKLAEIVLNIQPDPKDTKQNLLGQIFPTTPLDLTTVGVQLLLEGHEANLAKANELGEFTFGKIDAGDYALIVFTDTISIWLHFDLE